MIARTWRGEASAENADAYQIHLEHRVLPRIREISGHRGAFVLRKSGRRTVEFVVVTLWDSMKAVRVFAGEDPDAAVVPPAARALLSRFDSQVEHFEVVVSPPEST